MAATCRGRSGAQRSSAALSGDSGSRSTAASCCVMRRVSSTKGKSGSASPLAVGMKAHCSARQDEGEQQEQPAGGAKVWTHGENVAPEAAGTRFLRARGQLGDCRGGGVAPGYGYEEVFPAIASRGADDDAAGVSREIEE